jgi:hypothetical protein
MLLLPPELAPLVRDHMILELAEYGVEVPWFTGDAPEQLPPDHRFIVIDQLNTRQDTAFFIDFLTQFRIHDPDNRRCLQVAQLVNGLAATIPKGLEVQGSEHAGGPTELPDPALAGVRRWLVTWWFTLPLHDAATSSPLHRKETS